MRGSGEKGRSKMGHKEHTKTESNRDIGGGGVGKDEVGGEEVGWREANNTRNNTQPKTKTFKKGTSPIGPGYR